MPSKKGFASMSPEQHRVLSRKGGQRAHELGLAHTFTKEEAREAGRKGGLATRAKRNIVSEEIEPLLDASACE